MEKIYDIELDCIGDEDAGYDDIDAQKEALQRRLDDKKIDVKIASIQDCGNCYSVTYRGTMENLKKILIEFYDSDEDEMNGYIEDGLFEEV